MSVLRKDINLGFVGVCFVDASIGKLEDVCLNRLLVTYEE